MSVSLVVLRLTSLKPAMSISCHPGRVVTTNIIASLVGKAWPLSMAPMNIFSGFRKTGIHPLNTSDRPSVVVTASQARSGSFSHGSPVDTHSDPSGQSISSYQNISSRQYLF